MANFSPSNLVAAQTLLNAEFTSPEMREKILPTLAIGMRNKNPMIQNAEQLRTREDRPVRGYAMNRQVRSTTGGTRTANHTGARGDSMQMEFSWDTFRDTFSISLKQMDNNVFSFEQALAQNFKNCILNIHSDIESAAINFLQTNRTQVVKTTSPVGSRVVWNGTNFAHEIATGDANVFTQLMQATMRANYYNDTMFDAIYNNQAYVNAQFYQSQGSGNATNTAFQFTGTDITPSIELEDANYAGLGVVLAMRKMTYAMLPWIPKQNRMGYGDYNSYLGGYGSLIDPITNPGGIYSGGLVFAIHGYALRADTSSENGVEQDNEMEFEVSVDIANAITPLSTANESVIYEFVQQ